MSVDLVTTLSDRALDRHSLGKSEIESVFPRGSPFSPHFFGVEGGGERGGGEKPADLANARSCTRARIRGRNGVRTVFVRCCGQRLTAINLAALLTSALYYALFQSSSETILSPARPASDAVRSRRSEPLGFRRMRAAPRVTLLRT